VPHRGAPLASGCGHARALSCPYHAWLYRLDGSLVRAGGVGQPAGFDAANFGLREIQVASFARSIMVNVDPSAPPFDCGPLGRGLDPYRLDELELAERARYECGFNWKVLLENYCENYHTPFIHSQLPVGGYEYPIEFAGNVVFAWDRPLDPRDRSEQALHDHRPGQPGWAAVADVAADESFNNGCYLALFPNTAVSCFAGFAATFRLTPTGPSTTVVEREYLWHPSVAPERRAADLAATREVVEQDLAICTALQGTYDAGLSADGVLSTEHEAGVAHIHQLLLAALAAGH
jgi:glycine betaine catabolism A